MVPSAASSRKRFAAFTNNERSTITYIIAVHYRHLQVQEHYVEGSWTVLSYCVHRNPPIQCCHYLQLHVLHFLQDHLHYEQVVRRVVNYQDL